jgi:hypothetical protein
MADIDTENRSSFIGVDARYDARLSRLEAGKENDKKKMTFLGELCLVLTVPVSRSAAFPESRVSVFALS